MCVSSSGCLMPVLSHIPQWFMQTNWRHLDAVADQGQGYRLIFLLFALKVCVMFFPNLLVFSLIEPFGIIPGPEVIKLCSCSTQFSMEF